MAYLGIWHRPKKNRTHRVYSVYKAFATCWSGCRIQVWVQVWAPAVHLKAVPRSNKRFWHCMTFAKTPKRIRIAFLSIRFKIGLKVKLKVKFSQRHFSAWAVNPRNWTRIYGRQWPEVYDLCHTFLHTVQVKEHTDIISDMLKSYSDMTE